MSEPKFAASISHVEATIREFRADPVFAAEYLKSALEELDDPQHLDSGLLALADVMNAYGGVNVPLGSNAALAEAATDIAEFLFRQRGHSAEPTWFSEVFGRLVWLVEDNGAAICKTLENWILAGSVEKARVALAFDEAYLFQTYGEAQHAFAALSSRFPELSSLCASALASRPQAT